MAELVVRDDRLAVVLSTWEKVGALSGGIDVPLDAVTGVRRVDDASAEVHGLRLPGTSIPGRIRLGSYRGRSARTFVAAYRHDAGYVIDLTGESYDRLVVSHTPVAELDARIES